MGLGDARSGPDADRNPEASRELANALPDCAGRGLVGDQEVDVGEVEMATGFIGATHHIALKWMVGLSRATVRRGRHGDAHLHRVATETAAVGGAAEATAALTPPSERPIG